jgi:hypothetical protein
MMNLYFGLVRAGAPLMSEIVADPLSPSCYFLFFPCYHLFSGDRI